MGLTPRKGSGNKRRMSGRNPRLKIYSKKVSARLMGSPGAKIDTPRQRREKFVGQKCRKPGNPTVPVASRESITLV